MAKRTKKVLALATMVLFLVGMVGCGGGQDKKEGANQEETLKVGVNFELSGSVADYGTKAANGATLAFEEINAQGGVLGKKIDPIKMDNKSDNAEAANVAARLAGKNIVAFVGPATTGKTLAASEIATESKIPLISPTATDPSVTVDPKTKAIKEYIFRACFLDPFQGTVMAKFSAENLKATKAAILMDTSNDYSKGLAKAFKEGFKSSGGQIVAEEGYVEKDKDFKATLTRIKAKNPEVIFVPGYYNEVGLVVRQGRELGITVPFVGGDGWGSPQLTEIAGGAALNGTYFCNHFSTSSEEPKAKAFIEAYKKKYGTEPDAFAALGYDAAYLLINAIQQANSTEAAALTKALAETKDFPGVSGLLTMDPQHNPIKTAIIIEMVDGKQVVKTTIKP